MSISTPSVRHKDMNRKWWTLAAVSVATFMLLLDITVVNTALPAIQEDLGASFTELQWVIDAYSLALIAQEFPSGRERGMAMGLYGATIGVAVAVGPLVGGALTDSLGWESIFYLNVPIGLGAIALAYLRVRESRDPGATGVDWAGVATFSSALFLLVLALVRGNDEGWASTLIVSLFAGAAALLAL